MVLQIKNGDKVMCEKKPDYLVLVNEDNPLPSDFIDSVELVLTENLEGEKFYVEKKTLQAFLRLSEDLLTNDNIQTFLLNSYRTIEKQQEIFEENVVNFGIEHAKKYVAIPGHSEHHTGFAIDVGIILDGKIYRTQKELLSVDHLFKKVQAKLFRYGFILRYPKGKEGITKIAYEPWHYRYIDSAKIAKEITEKGLCFEEYCKKD